MNMKPKAKIAHLKIGSRERSETDSNENLAFRQGQPDLHSSILNEIKFQNGKGVTMQTQIVKMINDFEHGRLSRRQLIAYLTSMFAASLGATIVVRRSATRTGRTESGGLGPHL